MCRGVTPQESGPCDFCCCEITAWILKEVHMKSISPYDAIRSCCSHCFMMIMVVIVMMMMCFWLLLFCRPTRLCGRKTFFCVLLESEEPEGGLRVSHSGSRAARPWTGTRERSGTWRGAPDGFFIRVHIDELNTDSDHINLNENDINYK